MAQLPSFLPFAFTVFAYVVCIKLAARLFRRTQLSWKHAAIFGVVLFLVLFVVGACVRWLTPASGPVLFSLLNIAAGLLAQLALGAWLLGPRARTVAGAPLAFKGGAVLALIAYGLVFFLTLAAAVVLPLLARLATGRA